ncbi:hypothetical protein C943_02626 [Mariniradius saccharolyticus AK6]|uniref:Uncharacterized protein n=1 Tax=Mariniradius saccharolyticus AK6 TaxID=1239962 RepID=M7X8K7_9BACT|nr:hypothetical protein C943_02626 [Mariniradius saccharolyticus AK6]
MDKDDRSVNLKKLDETTALRLAKQTEVQRAQVYFSQRRKDAKE